MLHAMHNMLNKGALFFLAGFIWRMYDTNDIRRVRGALLRSPLAGILMLAALCATCGLPPFGMFFSELGIVLAAARDDRWWVLVLFVFTLTTVFVGVMTAMLPMVLGDPRDETRASELELPSHRWRRNTMLGATAALLALGLGLGSYQPTVVREALVRAADSLYHPAVEAIALATNTEARR
jgi:hydrogenase-4 component F